MKMEEIVLANQSAEHVTEAEAFLCECNFQVRHVIIRFFTSILDRGRCMYEGSRKINKMDWQEAFTILPSSYL